VDKEWNMATSDLMLSLGLIGKIEITGKDNICMYIVHHQMTHHPQWVVRQSDSTFLSVTVNFHFVEIGKRMQWK